MKIEVPHHPDSEIEIKETYARYRETDHLPEYIKDGCVIHIYPYADTVRDNGELEGYCDAYNCELHIFDVNNKTVYKTKAHDAVDLKVKSEVRIFKDLSTMIIIGTPVRFGSFQKFEVYEFKT